MVELQEKTVLDPTKNISLGALNELCKQSRDPLIGDITAAVQELYPSTKVISIADFITTVNELRNSEVNDKHDYKPAWSIHHHFLVNVLRDCVMAN